MAPSDGDLLRLAGPLRVLTLDDLRGAGLSRKELRTRVEQERIQRLWQEVFVIGPAPVEPLSYARAASLHPARFVTGAWGAYVHRFGPAPPLPVDVVAQWGSHRGIPGKVRVHESGLLLPGDYGEAHGVAVTSPARAILDSGDYASVAQLESFIAEARVKKLVTIAALEAIASRAGRRKAAARLAKALESGPGITRSDAERMLRRILREAGIEQPITGYKIGIYEADFAWPQYMLIVEFDSWSWHSGKAEFHHDRARNAHLVAKEWSVLPITWRMLEERPFEVVRLIAEAIARRSQADRRL